MVFRLHTVVEMKTFEADAKRLFSNDQIDEIVNTLAVNPEKGAIISGTGGFRKWRFANIKGKGKSGGSRIVHYYADGNLPVFLMMAFAKEERDNLSDAQKNDLRKIAAGIKKEYRK